MHPTCMFRSNRKQTRKTVDAYKWNAILNPFLQMLIEVCDALTDLNKSLKQTES